jgi:hypothetical protein
MPIAAMDVPLADDSDINMEPFIRQVRSRRFDPEEPVHIQEVNSDNESVERDEEDEGGESIVRQEEDVSSQSSNSELVRFMSKC